jgi:peptidoglycan/LPS O-acetylase OafA/YrhL
LIGPSWTLRHELLFYALFSILLINRKLGLAVLSLWAITIVIALPMIGGSIIPTQDATRILLHHYNLDFFLGMAVATAARGAHLKLVAAMALVVSAVLFVLHGQVSIDPDSFLRVFAFKSAFVAALAFTVLISQAKVPAPNLLILLGAASYSIYLTNRDVGFGIARVYRKIGIAGFDQSPVSFVLSVSIATAIGIILHFAFETPTLKFVNSRPWASSKVPDELPGIAQ